MRYDSQRLNQQTTAIGGGGENTAHMGNSGIGHVTQQNRNIGIEIEQRDRNCKIGEGGGLACRISGRETNDILLRGVVELLLELLVLGLYSRRTK